MMDKELVSECLITLRNDYDTKISRDAIETLLKIYRNILHNEDNTRFRVIKPENQAFSNKVWNLYPCRQLMLLSGWLQVHGKLVFNSDENLLDVIDILLQYRDVTPSAFEWEETTKHEGKSEEQLREEQLRMQAAEERQKELNEFMKEKKYQEELAKSIKAQIISDHQNKKQTFTQPVVGNKLRKGAKIKTLQSGSCNSASQ